MTVVLGVLFLVGLESNLQLKLIPNNIRYKRPSTTRTISTIITTFSAVLLESSVTVTAFFLGAFLLKPKNQSS